jgi:flagellar M-ring protein FliF
MLQFTKDDIMNMIELGVMSLLGLVVIFMVVRPLVRRILTADPAPAKPEPAAVPALADAGAQAAATGQNLIPGSNATAQLIDVAQVQGQVHAQSVHRVGELAERNPNETASIIRQWLAEQPA